MSERCCNNGDSSFKDLGRLKGGCEACFVSGNALISTGFFLKYRQAVQKMLGNSHSCICSFILLLNDTSWVLMMLLIVQSDAHFYTQASGREQF